MGLKKRSLSGVLVFCIGFSILPVWRKFLSTSEAQVNQFWAFLIMGIGKKVMKTLLRGLGTVCLLFLVTKTSPRQKKHTWRSDFESSYFSKCSNVVHLCLFFLCKSSVSSRDLRYHSKKVKTLWGTFLLLFTVLPNPNNNEDTVKWSFLEFGPNIEFN